MKNKRITLSITSIMIFLLFHVIFIQLPYLSWYKNLKYSIILIVGIFLFNKLKVLFNKRFIKVNLILFIYLTIVLFSSYINRNDLLVRDTFFSSIVFSVIIIEVFLLFEYISIKNKTKDLLYILLRLSFVYVVITDIILVINPSLHIQKDMYYFIGNKFVVAYLHLQLIALYIQCIHLKIIKKSNINYFLLCMWTIFICIKIECSTGLIALIIMIILIRLKRIFIKLLKKPYYLVFILILTSAFLFIFSNIVKNEFFQYIIVDILNEDISLSGRMVIYDQIEIVLGNSLWFGYGYGSSYEVMMNFIGFPNTQNGLLECILEQGVIGTVLLITLSYNIFKYTKLSNKNNGAIIMIYVYIFISCVEITLGISFLTWLALVFIISNEKN